MTYRSKAILWILGVFATGAVFGSTCAYLWMSPSGETRQVAGPPGQQPGDDSEERRGGDRRERRRPENEIRAIAQALDLDESQRGELRRIFNETKERYDVSQKQHWMQQRQIRHDMLRSIRTLLRAEQQPKLEEYLQDQQERFRRAREERQKRRESEENGKN